MRWRKSATPSPSGLLLAGATRIHLDRVEGLGDFLELEVVLREGQPESEGHAQAAQLLQALGLERAALLAGSYLDLAPASCQPPSLARGKPETTGNQRLV